ncbi:hypothetical protein N7532_007319 [Penicillium argentinense]|uniref:Uncharacterized protein n=1 Tax=Penicillium argentinense TaxID=1131581 RepID=A0A9W9F7G3_9EURO|nr:uncharacterized protein N7532_007319 [Penicillium argentinense]KAJ5095028.1 hypothetical protein N7532_007319 [Penicillium argentinense]
MSEPSSPAAATQRLNDLTQQRDVYRSALHTISSSLMEHFNGHETAKSTAQLSEWVTLRTLLENRIRDLSRQILALTPIEVGEI